MKKIAIINFTGFRGNWGCQATSFELVKFIAGCFPADEALNFTCVPLLPTSTVDRHYDGELEKVFGAFTQVYQQNDHAASSLAYLEQACVQRYGFWAEVVRAADLVVFQAEGSMGLGEGFARGPRLMLLPFVAKHAWKRKVVSLNQSFYSHNAQIIQNAVETFSSFDFTAFREGASVALARHKGVKGAFYVPDLAFMTPPSDPPQKPRLDRAQRYFAVSGSALKDPSRYDLILALSARIADATGLQPVLAVSRDVRLTIKTWLRFGKPAFLHVPREATYTRVAALLGRCEFLLGGRYHMSIIASTASTPSIFLPGNSFKNDGLASLMQSSRPVRAFADTAAILQDVTAILAGRDAERARLSAQLARIRAVIGKAQEAVSRVIAGETVRDFDDGLPAFDLPSDLLERYRKYGGGSASQGIILPGARLGRMNSSRDLLPPLLDGSRADAATRRTLNQLTLADPSLAQAVGGF